MLGDGDDAAGAENRVAGVGGDFEAGGEFFDVGTSAGDGGGELADDAGAIVAGNIDGQCAADFRGRKGFTDSVDGEALGGKGVKLGNELVHDISGAFDADDAGKLTGETGHAAFVPISAVGGDGIREDTDQTGAIRAENGHDEGGGHAEILSRRA